MTSQQAITQGVAGKAITMTLAVLGTALTASTAQAETYRFEQGGYTDGATLSITIEGPAGLISERSWSGITQIDVSFTGNAEMPALSFSSRNEDGGDFVIVDGLADDLTLGNTEGDGIYITLQAQRLGIFGFFTPGSGAASMTTTMGYNQPLPDGMLRGLSDSTLAPMRLTSPVPEPAAIAMMAIGLTGLMSVVQRSRRARGGKPDRG